MSKMLVALISLVSGLAIVTIAQGNQEKCVGPYAIPTVSPTPTATATPTPTTTATPTATSTP